MKISIVIVNYNVRYFLEQCLRSVQKALAGIEGEVWVVDNNSVDGSVEMVREQFPWVKVIANRENLGFSRANNQAMRQSSGEYILLLNPDTILQENSLCDPLKFMDEHPEAGGLGVRMIDGQGRFLKESKRGLPTPPVALYKILGLNKLFPKSPRFAKYHLGHLSEHETNEVDVLAGAYMLMRKSALDRVGLLDEDYFMYGEDIDLSYRIQQGGYKNYYFAGTSILHYKGESTKKGSLNYVYVFYNAMAIFARKHFSRRNARAYALLIRMAIWLRATLSVLKRFAERLALPLADFAVLFGGMYFLKTYWERNHRFIHGGEYPWEYTFVVIPVYILLWQVGGLFGGAYDRPVRYGSVFRGVAWSTVLLLAVYALLPEELRFSRALILLGSAWAFAGMVLLRYLWSLADPRLISRADARKRLGIVGDPAEASRVELLLQQTGGFSFIGYIQPAGTEADKEKGLGRLDQIHEILRVYELDEVIFCGANLEANEILQAIGQVGEDVEVKIAPPESHFVIGSHSVNTQGELYTVRLDALSRPQARRAKRTLDLVMAVMALVLSPFIWFGQKEKRHYFTNLFRVMAGRYSWVGFDPRGSARSLPRIKPGVLHPSDKWEQLDLETADRLNVLYAKSFRWEDDLSIWLRGWRNLGRKVEAPFS